jgi:hypothetical protein
MEKHMAYEDPKQLLEELIANWPVKEWNKGPRSEDEKHNLRKRFGRYLSPEFDVTDLGTHLEPSTVMLSDALIVGKVAKIVVHARPDLPYLALLRQEEKGWLLYKFTFQCITCFGVGVYGKDVCNVCGGTGWGTLGELEFCKGE